MGLVRVFSLQCLYLSFSFEKFSQFLPLFSLIEILPPSVSPNVQQFSFIIYFFYFILFTQFPQCPVKKLRDYPLCISNGVTIRPLVFFYVFLDLPNIFHGISLDHSQNYKIFSLFFFLFQLLGIPCVLNRCRLQ